VHDDDDDDDETRKIHPVFVVKKVTPSASFSNHPVSSAGFILLIISCHDECGVDMSRKEECLRLGQSVCAHHHEKKLHSNVFRFR
jgi:hypothetical protein